MFEIPAKKSRDHLDNGLLIDVPRKSEMGVLPNGKPTLADAQQFYDCAKAIYQQVEGMLGPNRPTPPTGE